MSSVAEIIEQGRTVARTASPEQRARAAAVMLDSILTTMLGHTAPEVERILAQETGGHDATVQSLPGRKAGIEHAAYANALALCWYELDPGFRHAGCHVPLHTLPALMAAAECNGLSVGETISRFIFCYEVVAELALTWDTRPSGLHSHAVFSHLGAVVAVAAVDDANAALIEHVLNLASSAVNAGHAWETARGGELRNLWPATAAAGAWSLYRAAKAGVTTSMHRLETSFDQMFRRRTERTLRERYEGPALSQTYGKLLPTCRHLHTGLGAALALRSRMSDADVMDIRAVHVSAHPDAADLNGEVAPHLLNAQFSMPVSMAIALTAGQLDPEDLLRLRDDAAVLSLASRIQVDPVPTSPYPRDRSATVEVALRDGRSMSETVAVAPDDPGGRLDPAEFVRRKRSLIAGALGPEGETFLRVADGLERDLGRSEMALAQVLARLHL